MKMIEEKDGMDDEMEGRTLPPEQELDMEGMDNMDGYAEGNAPPEKTAVATPVPEKPALADVVPEANTAMEDRLAVLENQLRAIRDAPPPERSATTNTAAVMPGETEWAQFKADYPDIAGPIEKMLSERDKTREAQTAALHTRIFEEAMDVARPDWRDLRDNPEFQKWIQANPDQQQAAQVPGVRAALKVLAAFDASRKGDDLAVKRQERLKASEATPAKGSRAPSLSDSLDGWAAA